MLQLANCKYVSADVTDGDSQHLDGSLGRSQRIGYLSSQVHLGGS